MTRTKRTLVKSLKDKRGSVAPMFGLMVMPMFFVIGISIDYSRAIAVENNLQNSLDAAALAAMQSNSSDPEAVGTKIFNENFNDARSISSIVHFTKLSDGTVRATASVSVPTTVANMMGVNTLQVETFSVVEPSHEVTSSETTTVNANTIPCLHVMDQSGAYTFDMSGNKNLDADQCLVHVRSNSNSAVRATNSQNVKFKKIRVKGSGAIDGGAATTTSTGTIESDAAITANPYMESVRDVVQAISIGSCTNANTNKTWSGSVSPGTYCGSTQFKNATFAAGLYIIKSGSGNSKNGNLKFSGSINGNAGVSFFLADSKTTFSSYNVNNGSVLKAPADGTTRGLLFFEDSNRGATWTANFSTCHTSSWEGLVYLPSANLTLSIEDWNLFHVSMAVNQLDLTNVEDIEWLPFSWTPFNTNSAISLVDETTTTTTSTTATDIYLKE